MNLISKVIRTGDLNRKSRFHAQNSKRISNGEILTIPLEVILRILGVRRKGPWLAKPAVRAIKKILHENQTNMRVLEIGGGFSSLFFAPRCHFLTVVEENQDWAKFLKLEIGKLNSNFSVLNIQVSDFLNKKMYEEIDFDFVLIDSGSPDERRRALIEISQFNPGAIFVLDNSDWKEFQNIELDIAPARVENYLGLIRKPFQVNQTSIFYFKQQ